MKDNNQEYAEKMCDLLITIHGLFEDEDLTKGEVVDVIAGLLLHEVLKNRAENGQDGVTVVLERFMRRMSTMPGLEARIVERRTKE
jgi:hypothetical protein